MFIPVMVCFWFMRSVSKIMKLYAAFLFCVFIMAIILSFARAGWLSLTVALGILLTIFLRIKFKTLLIPFASLAIVFFTFQTEILMALSKNSTDAEGGFENNIESISNISTDASNLERLAL